MNRKRMSLVLALAAVLVLAALGWLVPLSRNSQAAPPPPSDAVFKGKLLVVIMDKETMPFLLLEKAQVQKIGDHSFLVGKGVAYDEDDSDQRWFKGRTVRIRMEHVVSIAEFDNLKEFIKALSTTPDRARRAGYGLAAPPRAGSAPVPAPPDAPPGVVPAPPGK